MEYNGTSGTDFPSEDSLSIDAIKQRISEISEKDLIQVDEILIENQPSLKNPNMKTIACILYSYFVMRGIIDKEKNKSPIKFVKFISPSNKLKVDKINMLIFLQCFGLMQIQQLQ